ncbi:MAG TPA: hypothetical protein VK645_03380 [Chitinophagaceae bacterium]|nr:hypothetical protein [Chitinophagaceae bacterium]
MRFIIYLATAFCFSSCAAVAVKKDAGSANKPIRTEIVGSYEQTWNKITNYFYIEGYAFKTTNKEQGILTCELKDAFVSYKDKEGNIKNPTAFAITDVRKRINNNVYVYPLKGIIEWQILIQKKDENSTYVYLSLNPKGILTKYNYNTFEVNKVIKNVELRTTGIFEQKLADEFAKANLK